MSLCSFYCSREIEYRKNNGMRKLLEKELDEVGGGAANTFDPGIFGGFLSVR